MNKPTQLLSSRWTHAERDGIVSGRMGHGDVSSWAHATSKPFGTPAKPIRPEVAFKREAFTPIRSLGKIKPMLPTVFTHAASDVVIPGDNKDETVAAVMKDLDKSIKKREERIRQQLAYGRFYRGRVKKTGKPAPTPEPVSFKSVLDDCPNTDPSVIASLRGNVMERD